MPGGGSTSGGVGVGGEGKNKEVFIYGNYRNYSKMDENEDIQLAVEVLAWSM